MMPGESGLSLTKFIKKNNPMPIILLTAKGNTSDRIEGLEVGADDYLGKPFEPKELLLRINDNQKQSEIVTAEPKFISMIGLNEHLSPTRNNGLNLMIERIKKDAGLMI